MITSNINNFGSGSISLKCYSENSLVILDGVISIDPTNENYLSASELEVTFDSNFPFQESDITMACIASGNWDSCFGTIIKAQIKDYNKLVLEKLDIYDDRGEIKIYLNSAFIVPGDSDVICVEPSVLVYNSDSATSLNYSLRHVCNSFKDGYGYMAGYFHVLYAKNADSISFTLKNFPTDVDTYMPLFLTYFSEEDALGTKLFVAHISNGVLTVVKDESEQITNTGRAFFNFFFVRDNIT